MERPNQFHLIPSLILGLVCLIHSHTVAASEYSYYVDYFRVDGNLPVAQQDDFNDGNVSPWVVDDGTVEESGGYVNLKTPGDLDIDGAISSEYTDLETSATSAFRISVGSGSATATSRWAKNVMPSLNQAYMMGADFDFNTGDPLNGGDIEFDVGLINHDQTTADAIGEPGLNAELSAIFVLYLDPSIGEGTVLSLQVAPIVDLTLFDDDSLFLNLHYDDFTQEVSASIVFGDDATATAWEPFNKVAMPAHPGDLVFDDWDLEATSFSVVPIPAALPLLGTALGLGLFGYIGRRRKALKRIT